MAVVKMGQIKTTLAKSLAYISRPDATCDGLWVSTNAAVIDPGDFKAVARQMAETAARVGVSKPRAGGVLAHHVIQSFDPRDEMATEVAHRLGVQLAERITGGTHEYMIATHLDKGHVHNHIIFNAVNLETGRKFRVQKSTIGRLRDVSDELCQKEGLAVLPKPERPSGRSFADIYRVLKGESAKEFLRVEIDKAAVQATSWNQFEGILARAGVETSVRGGRNGTVSFREITMGRAVRDWRLGAAYTEESIMARLSRTAVNMVAVDCSLIVKEGRETLTVSVPGTKRQLQLTVATRQVVRHGRALRIYVPAAGTHPLADRKGNYVRSLSTAGLYEHFSKPDLNSTVRAAGQQNAGSGVHRWSGVLADLRDLRDRVNAKSRWMSPANDLDDAIRRAGKHLEERHLAFQSALVAVTEVVADPTRDADVLRQLEAELRIIERELAVTRDDVRALSQLTREEVKMSVADRIAATTAPNQQRVSNERRGEEAALRARREDHANDRETPAHREEMADEEIAQTERLEDQQNDRDGGSRSMTLQERIAAEAEAIKRRSDGERTEGTDRRWTL